MIGRTVVTCSTCGGTGRRSKRKRNGIRVLVRCGACGGTGGTMRRHAPEGETEATMENKKKAVVKFAKGITISKNYQSVRYEVGVEMEMEVGADGRGFRDAVEQLEEMVNRELKRRKDRSTGGLFGLGGED